MAERKSRTTANRDISKTYPAKQFIAKLRRLADCLEQGKQFTITVGKERIRIPASALIHVEHERSGNAEEVEFQLSWTKDVK